MAEEEVYEYDCTMPVDPESLCHAPAIAVNIKEDSGLCLEHIYRVAPMYLAGLSLIHI